MRKRLAVFAEGGDFRKSVARTSEELFSRGGIESNSDLLAGSFVEFRISEIHRGMIAVHGDARPGNIHGRRIENDHGADGACCTEGFPALAGSLIVGGECGRDVRRRAREIDHNFPFEVEARELIEIFFGDFEAVADENKRSGGISGGSRSTETDESIISEGKRPGLAVADKGEGGFCLIHFKLCETDRLVKAVGARRLEGRVPE